MLNINLLKRYFFIALLGLIISCGESNQPDPGAKTFTVLAVNGEPSGIRINFSQPVDRSTVKFEQDSIFLTKSDGEDVDFVPTFEVKDKQVDVNFAKTGGILSITIGKDIKSTNGESLKEIYSKSL